MKTYTTVDKTGWGDGPWQHEPDKISWTDQATGLPCLIVRNRLGSLCGYAGVTPDHPWHGLRYDVDAALGVIDVHGGLTYSEACDTNAPEDTGICHTPDPEQPDHVWWFGFDTAHSGDLTPSMNQYTWRIPNGNEVYRDITYVEADVTQLAAQLAHP